MHRRLAAVRRLQQAVRQAVQEPVDQVDLVVGPLEPAGPDELVQVDEPARLEAGAHGGEHLLQLFDPVKRRIGEHGVVPPRRQGLGMEAGHGVADGREAVFGRQLRRRRHGRLRRLVAVDRPHHPALAEVALQPALPAAQAGAVAERKGDLPVLHHGRQMGVGVDVGIARDQGVDPLGHQRVLHPVPAGPFRRRLRRFGGPCRSAEQRGHSEHPRGLPSTGRPPEDRRAETPLALSARPPPV